MMPVTFISALNSRFPSSAFLSFILAVLIWEAHMPRMPGLCTHWIWITQGDLRCFLFLTFSLIHLSRIHSSWPDYTILQFPDYKHPLHSYQATVQPKRTSWSSREQLHGWQLHMVSWQEKDTALRVGVPASDAFYEIHLRTPKINRHKTPLPSDSTHHFAAWLLQWYPNSYTCTYFSVMPHRPGLPVIQTFSVEKGL